MNRWAKPMADRRKHMATIALICLSLSAGICAYLFTSHNQLKSPPSIESLIWPPYQLGNFSLESTEDATLDLAQLKDRWSFIFFGYTNCPDVCPMTMTTLAATVSKLQAVGASDSTQVIFVSIDPNRDTISHMETYVKYFDTAFIGATGEIEEINVLSSQLGVAHIRSEPNEEGIYTVDHSASIMLIDPKGRKVGVFGSRDKPDEIAENFQSIKKYVESQS